MYQGHELRAGQGRARSKDDQHGVQSKAVCVQDILKGRRGEGRGEREMGRECGGVRGRVGAPWRANRNRPQKSSQEK